MKSGIKLRESHHMCVGTGGAHVDRVPDTAIATLDQRSQGIIEGTSEIHTMLLLFLFTRHLRTRSTSAHAAPKTPN